MPTTRQLNKRLKAQKKVLERKQRVALRNDEYISGHELARLNRVAGRIEKNEVYEYEEEDQYTD